MKKTLIWLLIAALLLPCLFSACMPNNVPQKQETTPEATTPETTTPETPENKEPIEELKLETVSIATGNSESEIYAGQELASYLQKKGVQVADGAFPITISINPELEDDAFQIDAVLNGDNAGMTIVGGNERGALYGVYKFLEEYGDVRYFTPNLERCEEGDVIIHEGSLLEYTPFFEARRLNWNSVTRATDWCTKQGINGHDGEMEDKYGGKQRYGSGLFVHTLAALSEYDSNKDGKLDSGDDNPCLSDPAIYATVIKNLRAALEKDPTVDIVSVSQNDKNVYCKCDKCVESYIKYSYDPYNYENGGTAGNLLEFVNKIAEELEPEYPNLVIDTLAYNYTQAPPKDIVPRENVCIRVCSIRVCFMHPMTECPENKGPNGIQWTRTALFRTDFMNWGKICDRIYVWDYTTNFAYYIAPFCNFGAIRENMKFYHENGVRGMFPQGNSQSISGEFGELRAYLLAKLMWNPYMSEEEYYGHMDEFLKAYYGNGWIYIRFYIDKITELANDGCINIYEAPLEAITAAEYLANEADFEAWWDKAEAIAGDRYGAVHRSRFQWRYIQLLIHPDDEAALAFAEEIKVLGIRWAESSGNNVPLHIKFPELYPDLQPSS